ncbi:hypothetical protein [Streptomyces sp. NPDC091027]|uniref:hypothetical protein n=1 Tax=Streptomyces sp. NPDC091027 TaxID=3365971 RepID=UPI0038035D7C
MVDVATGKMRDLAFVAEKIKQNHIDEVEGTEYEYRTLGKVAGHLPDTTWSGKSDPYCWHQQDTRVSSTVGGDAQKYLPGYKPTGFYYAGVKGSPGTYTTERVTGTLSIGEHGICQIARP